MDAEKLAKMKAAAGVRIGEFSASKAQRARLEEVERMCETGEGQRHRVASASRSSRPGRGWRASSECSAGEEGNNIHKRRYRNERFGCCVQHRGTMKTRTPESGLGLVGPRTLENLSR